MRKITRERDVVARGERKKKGGRRGLDLEESTISRNEEGFFFSLSALKRKRKAELKGEGAGFFFSFSY